MPDYQFVHPLEAGRPFPVVAYSHNLQTNNDVITFNAMLNKKYNEGKQEGDNEGYERGRTESSSGKIKDKVKEKVRDKLTN
jgi:flagellar biosynthesis/type III secretory pathway protein FliH